MLIRKFGGIFIFWSLLLFVVAAPKAADRIVTVLSIPVGATVTLGGTVVPNKEVTFSAQIPGRVESISGEEGDTFEEGELLIAINNDDLLARRRAAWANLVNAEAVLRNAGIQYSREFINPYGGEGNDTMGGMSAIMRSFTNPMQGFAGNNSPWVDRHAQLYQQGTFVEQARSQLVTARSKIEEIDTQIRDAMSIAPFDGVITRKLVEQGDTVSAGQSMLEYSDMSKMQIRVEVPARLMPGVKKGMVFRARLDVGDVETEATVARVFPVADVDRHTVTVKLDLPSTTPGSAGMYCEVEIQDINTEVVDLPVVPVEALMWRGSLPGIYVMNEDNQRELRLVRIGDPVGADKVSILSGLKVGDRILIKDGDASESSTVRSQTRK